MKQTNFFKKVGGDYNMDTVDFAVAMRDASQTFVCGVLRTVSMLYFRFFEKILNMQLHRINKY